MRILIHPIFILVCVAAIYFAVTQFFLSLLIAIILHEFAHIVMAKFYGVYATKLVLAPFGGAVNLDTEILNTRQRCLIYLAGPLANFGWTLFFGVLIWLFPVAFIYFEYLVAANFLVGLMNILPIYPLDGGKIAAIWVKSKYVLWWSNLVLMVGLVGTLIKFNFGLIFVLVILLIQINWEFKTTSFNDKFTFYGVTKTGKFTRCAVLLKNSIFSIYQMVDKKRPTEFVISDLNNTVFYENDLERWLIGYPLMSPLSDIWQKEKLSIINLS